MIAKFLGLAFLAALNPKLLAIDLLLVKNRRALAMLVCVLIGAMAVSLAVGLADVLVVQADALKAQGPPSAGLDLALGLLLLAAGGLIASRRLLPGRHRARGGHPNKEKEWAQRVLTEPRLALAVLIGVLIGTPGGEYLIALHILVTGKPPAAIQVIAVVFFVVIEFALLLIPVAFLVIRPQATQTAVKRAQGWLVGHERQLITAIVLILGAYLVASALVRLS